MCLIIRFIYCEYDYWWFEVHEYDSIKDRTFWFCEREEKKKIYSNFQKCILLLTYIWHKHFFIFLKVSKITFPHIYLTWCGVVNKTIPIKTPENGNIYTLNIIQPHPLPYPLLPCPRSYSPHAMMIVTYHQCFHTPHASSQDWQHAIIAFSILSGNSKDDIHSVNDLDVNCPKPLKKRNSTLV